MGSGAWVEVCSVIATPPQFALPNGVKLERDVFTDLSLAQKVRQIDQHVVQIRRWAKDHVGPLVVCFDQVRLNFDLETNL